jgi:phosphatidylinositol alpha-mannosyltransferase
MTALHLAPPFGGGIARAAAAIADLAGHALATALPDTHPDTLHLHHALAWPEVLARFPDRRDRPRVIKTLHILQRRQNRLRGASETRSSALQDDLLRHADRLTIATRAARDMLLEDVAPLALPNLATRLRLLPLPPPSRVERAPTAHAGPIVFVGRFDRLKGTDLVVDLLPILRARHPERRIVIAGGLPDHGKAERRWLRAMKSADPQLSFAGWLSPPQLTELIAHASVFVAPSRLETAGLALMEALAAACPVVATDIPAHREVAGESAYLVATEAQALADGIGDLLTDPAAAERLGARGPNRLPDPAKVRSEWLHFWAENR